MNFIDIKTAIFFLCISSIFIVFMYLSYLVLNKSKNWSLITFIIGKILQTIGIIGFSFSMSQSDSFLLTTGYIFVLIGYAFEVFGITSFDLVFRKKNFYSIFISAMIFVLLVVLFLNSPDYQKRMIFSMAGVFYFGFGGIYFIRLSGHTRFDKLIGFTYIMFSVVFLMNIVTLSYQNDNFQLFATKGSLDLIICFTGYFVILLGGIGLLMIQREQNERIIKRDNHELKKLNAEKDKFFSIIAHDLKSPVGAIKQLLKILVKDYNVMDPVTRKELLDAIYSSSKVTYDLLENLLQWARTESGSISFNPKKINLLDIAISTVNLLHGNIRKKNLSINLNINAKDIAFADENMLMTVFRNLLSNAIKFTPKSGEISIESTISDNGFVKLDFADTGVGIRKNNLRNLFETQSEFSTTGTDGEIGTGLGLKLCKEFIEKHKGEIGVKSRFNKGSEFWFTLPVTS